MIFFMLVQNVMNNFLVTYSFNTESKPLLMFDCLKLLFQYHTYLYFLIFNTMFIGKPVFKLIFGKHFFFKYSS